MSSVRIEVDTLATPICFDRRGSEQKTSRERSRVPIVDDYKVFEQTQVLAKLHLLRTPHGTDWRRGVLQAEVASCVTGSRGLESSQ